LLLFPSPLLLGGSDIVNAQCSTPNDIFYTQTISVLLPLLASTFLQENSNLRTQNLSMNEIILMIFMAVIPVTPAMDAILTLGKIRLLVVEDAVEVILIGVSNHIPVGPE
jgi:hypothetical protein